jgi:transposase
MRFRLMVKNEVRVYGLKHQKEKRSMDHFAGLDVSVKENSVCIVDDTGKIVREVKVASEPEALLALLKNPAYHFKRIGLEAGPLSGGYLAKGLDRRGHHCSRGSSGDQVKRNRPTAGGSHEQ